MRHFLLAPLAVAICLPMTAQGGSEEADTTYRPPAETTKSDWPRERLVGCMRELAGEVYEHHVVRDPSRRTYGMTYEYLRDGKKMQDFGLDTMHDGAWFMSAMITAHRSDPDGGYLKRALKYQVPFYVNILQNSDRLFPKMKPRQGQEEFSQPIKGWCPRGWDDGLGIDLEGRSFSTRGFYDGMRHEDKQKSTTLHLAGDRVEHAYFTSSHHLLQDLADGLLNVWLTTRDPQVASAIMAMHQGRVDHGRPIPVVRVAAGISNSKEDLYQRNTSHAFTPESMRPYYTGAYGQKPERVVAYNDGVAWSYRDECARASIAAEQIDVQAAFRIAASGYGLMNAMEAFHPVGEYRYGDWFFDLGGNQGYFTEGTGQLGRYAEDGEPRLGTRGIQISANVAAVLPVVAANPDVWDQRYTKQFADDLLVRIVDTPPRTDGKVDEIYGQSQQFEGDNTSVRLLSDPRHLHLVVQSTKPQVVLRIKPADKVSGEVRTGIITIEPSRAQAANDAGEKIRLQSSFTGGERWTAELRIPYTIVKGQQPWINGVDHGRYSLQVNDEPSKNVYLLSTHARFVRRLEALSLGTIALWCDYFNKHGSIPSGYYPTGRAYRWNCGDAGNYGHLVKAIAFWLMYQAGTSEWELIAKQTPPQPIEAFPLPDSVLTVQGLK